MTDSDRIIVVQALEKSKLGPMACFRIELVHGFYRGDDWNGDYWDVVLYPLINCIYVLDEITDIVSALALPISVYTDINRPGCIIFH